MLITQKEGDQFIKTMHDNERVLMLKVWNGYQPHQRITNVLYHLYAHFPKDKLEKALRWLVRNGKKDSSFIAFMNECGGTPLAVHKKLLHLVDNPSDHLRIVAGDNFRL
jgi:hypothetical protein